MDIQHKKCKFFIENKKRVCKFEVYKDLEFCQHHLQSDEFLVCPIDSSHTVLKDRLEHHLKICPKIKLVESMNSQVWFSTNINSKTVIEPEKEKIEKNSNISNDKEIEINKDHISKKKLLLDLQYQESDLLKNLILKIDLLFENAIKLFNENLIDQNLELTKEYLIPDIFTEKGKLTDTEKDFLQIKNLIDLMKKFNLINKNNIYVEFGAGKGNFSHYVALENKDNSAHILLEREPRRNKQDKNHRDNKNFIRVRTDIINFDINSIGVLLKDFLQGIYYIYFNDNE